MGRYRGPRLSIIRRLGTLPSFSKKKPKVSPKRLPLGHPVRRKKRKPSIYGKRLLSKQRCCFSYGLTDAQLKHYAKKASNTQGDPIRNLVYFLESRLDSRVFRYGIASTMPAARQLVVHGHITVEGVKVISPSYQCNKTQSIYYKNKKLTFLEEPKTLKKIKNKFDPKKITFSPIEVLEYYARR